MEGKNVSLSCSRTFAEAGQFAIVLRVRDASGREAMLMHDVSVTEAPPDGPVDVAVAVTRISAVITWTPGAWSTRQEVALSRTDASEPDRSPSAWCWTRTTVPCPGRGRTWIWGMERCLAPGSRRI